MTIQEDLDSFNTRITEVKDHSLENKASLAVHLWLKMKSVSRDATDEEWPEVVKIWKRIYIELLGKPEDVEFPDSVFDKYRKRNPLKP